MHFPTHSSNMPAELRIRLDAEYLENEETYVALRAKLMETHKGLWVGIANGDVVASGKDMMDVWDQALLVAKQPYLTRVGNEVLEVRIRSLSFAYDHEYKSYALPVVAATFSNYDLSQELNCQDVIPDTGADISLLPERDCNTLDLYTSPSIAISSRGVVGPAVLTYAYRSHVAVGNLQFDSLIQPAAGVNERILGRDTLNQCRVLFDGPAGQVVFDP